MTYNQGKVVDAILDGSVTGLPEATAIMNPEIFVRMVLGSDAGSEALVQAVGFTGEIVVEKSSGYNADTNNEAVFTYRCEQAECQSSEYFNYTR